MDGAKRLLCVGSGWIASKLTAHATEACRWPCHVAYQNFRNTAIAPEQMVQLPRTREGFANLLQELKPDYIVYALGSGFVFDIEANLGKAIEDNVVTLAHVCEAAASMGAPIKKLLVVGSASIYEPSESALGEDAAIAPIENYGMLKAVQERVALSFHERHGLPVVVARQFNTSGIGQNRRFVLPSIANQVAETLRGGHSGLKLRLGDTSAKRDFLAVTDTVAAYVTLLEHAAAGSVYNVCSGATHSVADLAQRACRLFGLEVEFDVQSNLVRKGEHRRPVLLGSCERLRSLGWEPHISLDSLIREMVEAELAVNTR